MLSELEVGQFRAFGYVLLRGCLSPAEVSRVTEAYEKHIATAPVYNYFGGGVGTRMLNPFVNVDDAFGALIEHPGVMEAARDIWGTECLFIAGSDMWANYDETPWHSDGQPGRQIKTLKTAIYLEEMGPDTGPLNVIPGSHHPDFCAAIFNGVGQWDRNRPRLRMKYEDLPGVVSLYTKPGDVILWDNRIWHSAYQRKDRQARRTMFIGYMPDPGDDLLGISDLRNTIKQQLNDKQPYVYSKAMLEKGGPAREKMAARLEALGVEKVREP